MKRVLLAVVVVLMLAFAAFGGEYGTQDLVSLKRRVGWEREAIRQLRHEVDSLARLARALRTDPVYQEKVARELYGMIRDGEKLYQVVPADSLERPQP